MHGWSKQTEEPNLRVSGGAYTDEQGKRYEEGGTVELRAFRAMSCPDTLAVFDMGVEFQNLPGTGGAIDQDNLRSVQAKGPRGWRNDAQRKASDRTSHQWHRFLRLLRLPRY